MFSSESGVLLAFPECSLVTLQTSRAYPATVVAELGDSSSGSGLAHIFGSEFEPELPAHFSTVGELVLDRGASSGETTRGILKSCFPVFFSSVNSLSSS